MSMIEDPVTTVIRLLSKNIKVAKEDGSVASVYVSEQWYDREFFKNYDAQVTVGLDPATADRKIGQSGQVRQIIGRLRVNLWSTDRAGSSDAGRSIRKKLVEEVKRVVHQNMKIPNQTIYDYYGLGYPSGNPHKAYQSAGVTELLPSDGSWIELSSVDYQKIWAAEGVDYSKSVSLNLDCSMMLFMFKMSSRAQTIQRILLSFVGYGTAPAGNGVTIKVWSPSASVWQNAASASGSSNQTVTITLTSNLANYVDANGCVWLLVRTTNPSNGTVAATINCDYVSCTVTVNGITYLDVVTFGDKDWVDVKPFIFRTEFVLKSWSFEDVGGMY